MDSKTFEIIVSKIIDALRDTAQKTPSKITTCKNGDDFELVVLEAVTNVLSNMNINGSLNHTPGGHAFPDIVIVFEGGIKYGIEVKSSSATKSKGWKINGNSVMGSTRDPEVIETYIIFGKTAKTTLEFKARKYEDCVANVVVTHSPRYLIDLDLPEGETFFNKSKIDYQSLNDSDNPIGMITSYFQQIGQKAWWLSESTPAAVRMFSDLDNQEQLEVIGYGFAHFPELFKRSNNKYKRLALWLATEKSIVASSLRDDFSAKGLVSLVLNGTTYTDLPQIFNRLNNYKAQVISALNQSEPETLLADWNDGIIPQNDIKSKVQAWISVAAKNVNTNQLPAGIDPLVLLKDIFYDYTD